ncbi:hypothetical protein PK35_12250 [Tamlana nanhaiensis]|uniref:Lipocalin-like domain-containing protein n=1 Tax=Neotamlana nanhaiensis TaxID=1382798 RepID=A0A0D7VZB9_9FLAO|nr:hypothetical protein [Tamlana nanhaiensis]KJD32196.1 hypothetical protein PK35_11365 [Tamlana nanhaiensis]KJD32358.1 hypothetical protein PK35_12250 [Tamlana nanhaiensis]
MKNFIKVALWVVVILMSLTNMTCEESVDTVEDSDNCDKTVVIDANNYNNLQTDYFTVVNAKIIGDCLSINFQASGCSGDTWVFNLIDSGAIAESYPEQRYLKIQFVNNEACLAVFTKQVSFNLKPLQISDNGGEVILHIDGLDDALSYKY